MKKTKSLAFASIAPVKTLGSLSIWRKLVAAVAAIAVVGAVESVPAADQKPTIPIIVKDTTTFFWQIVLAGARKAGRELNVTVPELGAQSESDINGQISILENAVSGKPAAIVIAPTQFKALGQPIDEAAKKVTIIGIDSAADSKAFTSFLTTDNVQAGRVAADALAAAIEKKYGKAEGEVALVTSIPGVGSLDARAKGFKEQLAAKYPGLKLTADKIADGQPTTGLNIMTDLITANPNLRGVFTSNLTMTQGAGQALAENKLGDKIMLIGFDSDDKTVKLLADGNVQALVVQDPFRMGFEGIKTALAASKGEKVPENVDTGANVITKENMNTERSKEPLTPDVTTAGLSTAIVMPFLALFLSDEVDVGPVRVTVFLVVSPLASVVMAWLIGRFSDRYPIRRALLIGASVAGTIGCADRLRPRLLRPARSHGDRDRDGGVTVPAVLRVCPPGSSARRPGPRRNGHQHLAHRVLARLGSRSAAGRGAARDRRLPVPLRRGRGHVRARGAGRDPLDGRDQGPGDPGRRDEPAARRPWMAGSPRSPSSCCRRRWSSPCRLCRCSSAGSWTARARPG